MTATFKKILVTSNQSTTDSADIISPEWFHPAVNNNNSNLAL